MTDSIFIFVNPTIALDKIVATFDARLSDNTRAQYIFLQEARDIWYQIYKIRNLGMQRLAKQCTVCSNTMWRFDRTVCKKHTSYAFKLHTNMLQPKQTWNAPSSKYFTIFLNIYNKLQPWAIFFMSIFLTVILRNKYSDKLPILCTTCFDSPQFLQRRERLHLLHLIFTTTDQYRLFLRPPPLFKIVNHLFGTTFHF